MKTKFVFISGGVISGIGKGVISASVALLLQKSGLKVVPVKCENYLNVDAGTINPIEHGDPFLCEDGTEADMDLGTYEKFLNINVGKANFITMGQIYQTVISRERKFMYNGEDVEAIPHLTDEIQHRIKEAGEKEKADVVVVELGGTAGEYQNVFYYEASRILAFKNPGDVVHIHVGYMPRPQHLGEPKTKPIQLSVRTLNGMGIQPDIIVARSEGQMDERRKARFSLFCNVNSEDIFSVQDTNIIYQVPLLLNQQNFTQRLANKLSLKKNKENLSEWANFVDKIKTVKNSKKEIKIAIVGKYFSTGDYKLKDSYAALFDALEHAGWQHGTNIKTAWIDAEKVEKEGTGILKQNFAGLIVPIGWGARGVEGMISAAGFARDQKIPYLGLCYGMQLACISFARDKIGWKTANTLEKDPATSHPVIHLNPHQKENIKRRAYGGTMRLGAWEAVVKKGTITWEAYKKHQAFIDESKGLTSERHRHRYEFNNDYSSDFEKKGLVISARSVVENLVEIIELPREIHPFYLGTQGHPEYKSRPLNPHPIFIEFINACLKSQG